jgi:hypothetical protein
MLFFSLIPQERFRRWNILLRMIGMSFKANH